MRRVLCFLLLISSFLILCACGSKSTNSADNPSISNAPDLNKDQYYLGTSNLRTITEGPDAYYFISGDYLYYMDKTDYVSHPLCRKADCLHDLETDYERMQNCDARFFSPYCLFYYDQALYMVQWIQDPANFDGINYATNRLYKYSLQGDFLGEVTELPTSALCPVQNDGILYYSFYDLDSEGDANDWGTVYLMAFDLKNNSEKCLASYQDNEIYDIGELFVYNNTLYARVLYLTNIEANPLGVKYLLLDLKTEEWSELTAADDDSNLTTVRVVNDSLVFSMTRPDSSNKLTGMDSEYSKNLYTANLDATHVKKQASIEYAAGIRFTYADLVIVSSANEFGAISEKNPENFVIYKNYKKIGEFDLSSIMLDTQYDPGNGRDESRSADSAEALCYSLIGDYLVLTYNSRGGACLVGIKIADLQKGQANPQVLFEFPAVK